MDEDNEDQWRQWSTHGCILGVQMLWSWDGRFGSVRPSHVVSTVAVAMAQPPGLALTPRITTVSCGVPFSFLHLSAFLCLFIFSYIFYLYLLFMLLFKVSSVSTVSEMCDVYWCVRCVRQHDLRWCGESHRRGTPQALQERPQTHEAMRPSDVVVMFQECCLAKKQNFSKSQFRKNIKIKIAISNLQNTRNPPLKQVHIAAYLNLTADSSGWLWKMSPSSLLRLLQVQSLRLGPRPSPNRSRSQAVSPPPWHGDAQLKSV